MKFLITLLTFCFGLNFVSLSQVDSVNFLTHIEGPIGKYSTNTKDLNSVISVISSRRLRDNFEVRVNRELQRLNTLGYRTDVRNIKLSTIIEGDKIITKSSCDIVKSGDGRTYVVLASCSSIGKNWRKNLNRQEVGFDSWLSFYFRGYCKKLETKVVNFTLKGQKVWYGQSFYLVARGF